MRAVLLRFVLVASLLVSCVESEVEEPSYEVGEVGTILITNPTPAPMAIGGCNPQFVEIREPGRWRLPANILYLACAFGTSLDGRHTLTHYQLISPGETVPVTFGTRFVEETPAIIRVRQRISVGCDQPDIDGAPITCRGVTHILTDPLPIFAPGTTEEVCHTNC